MQNPSCCHKGRVFTWMHFLLPSVSTGSTLGAGDLDSNTVIPKSVLICSHVVGDVCSMTALKCVVRKHERSQPVCFSTMCVLLLLAFNLTSPWTWCTSLIPGWVHLLPSLPPLSDLPRLLATEEQMESVLWPRYVRLKPRL